MDNYWTDDNERKYLLKLYKLGRYQLLCGQFCRKGLKRQTLSDGRVRLYTCCYQKIAATRSDIPHAIQCLAELVRQQLELGRVSCNRPARTQAHR